MTTTTAPQSRLVTDSNIVRSPADDLAPHINKAMNALDAASRRTRLEAPLTELVRLRASQLNGCAYCVDMHARDAREGGETERRLYALAVWRDTPFFTARERAALALTEAATRLTDGPVSDEVVAEAAKQFDEVELAELIWTIAVINAWNRLGATARAWPL
ncbi:MAG TPA: carboxymuconolactone decarboxylase family protein [Micromonosporaceae bacterium]|jgi:AhpD family alkylhydroperoxidase